MTFRRKYIRSGRKEGLEQVPTACKIIAETGPIDTNANDNLVVNYNTDDAARGHSESSASPPNDDAAPRPVENLAATNAEAAAAARASALHGRKPSAQLFGLPRSLLRSSTVHVAVTVATPLAKWGYRFSNRHNIVTFESSVLVTNLPIVQI